MNSKKFSFDDALLDPSKYYGTPKDAARDAQFSVAQRREILQAWQEDEEALIRASDEGLDGGERPHLRQVIEELKTLS